MIGKLATASLMGNMTAAYHSSGVGCLVCTIETYGGEANLVSLKDVYKRVKGMHPFHPVWAILW